MTFGYYSTNITLGGKNYVVALDTGSTDVWVHPTGPDATGEFNDTRIPLELRYGDGSYGVRGTIATAPFQMGSFNVSRQAFLHATYGTVGGIYELGLDGVLGLSFDFTSASPINRAVKARDPNATWAASPLKNILDSDPGRPNFVAIDLARTDDLEGTTGGSFAIGEYDEQWRDIANATKLTQFPKGAERWTTVLGGILVDGNRVNVTGRLVRGGGIATLLDTGDPSGVLPERIRDGIYSRIPGAVSIVQRNAKSWIVPCNSTAIVEFEFGGQKFPMHPLDLSFISDPITAGGKQYTACVGTIYGMNDVGGNEFEAVLGDVFLRNVYGLYDFGDTQANGTAGEPYMQLLSQTNTSLAVTEVAPYRNRTMASLPPEIPPAQLVELLTAQNPPVSTTDSDAPTCESTCTPSAVRRSDSTPLTLLTPREEDGSQDSSSGSVKRDPLLVSLLVLNLAVGIAVLGFGVLNYVRNGRILRRPMRTGAHYSTASASAGRTSNLDSMSLYAGSTQGGPFRGHYEELDGQSRSPSVTYTALAN
ncbi:acid protease [Coprinellus micaceus]|uniref:Acid protease n=1 Tax=Coprinellus micaceus TaxID=71717 RepID=A0A4Y7SY99_COPMI|nr:acid protease [Coprinellus micaceus]